MRTTLRLAYAELTANGYVSDSTRAALTAHGVTSVQLEQYVELRSPKENIQ